MTADRISELVASDESEALVFTQGDDWDDLKEMVRDAVICHFDDREAPRVIRLHFVREEAIAL